MIISFINFQFKTISSSAPAGVPHRIKSVHSYLREDAGLMQAALMDW